MNTSFRPIMMSLLLIFFGYLSINLILPVFPELAGIFQVSSTKMRSTMTFFFIAYGFGQLFWGVVADQRGCRSAVIMSVWVAMIGLILILCSVNFTMFLGGRVLEGFGVGATSVLARTILGDQLAEHALNQAMVYVVSLAGLLPGIAPFLGIFIYHLTGAWRAIFLCLGILGLGVYFVALWVLPARLQKPVSSGSMLQAWQVYGRLCLNFSFFSYLFIYGSILGLLINFYTIAPYIFMKSLNLTHHQYGFCVFAVGGSYLLGAFGTRLLLCYWSSRQILNVGLALIMIAVALILAADVGWQFSLVAVEIPMIVFAVGCGFLSPAVNAIAISSVFEKGRASALLACIVMVYASGFSVLTNLLPLDHLSTYLWVFGIASLLAWVFALRNRQS